VVEAKNGAIKGLSRRTLKVDKLTCPSGKFHLGLKRAYELWPSELVTRVKEERKKGWDAEHKRLLTGLHQQLVSLEKAEKGAADKVVAGRVKEDREDTLELVAQLNQACGKYEDAGPLYDCVVFHDGEVWRAVVDSNEDGELSRYEPMANFGEQLDSSEPPSPHHLVTNRPSPLMIFL